MSDIQDSFKVVIAGSSDTGKTSLVSQLVDKIFIERKKTIGVEFKSYSFNFNEEYIKLQLWDTAGQERFRSISKAYFRNSVGFILTFNLLDRRSFDDLTMWINDIHSLGAPNAYIILVGCKYDIESERVVSRSEAQRFADQHKIEYFEASSKTGFNVENIFQTLGKGIYQLKNSDILKENPILFGTNNTATEEEAEEDNEFSLNTDNLYDIPFDKYEEDFTIILNGQQHKTSRIVADILSPTIRNMHLSDPTIDEFIINTTTINTSENEGENYFQNFLKLCSFKPTVVDEESRKCYSLYFYLLGNIKEFYRLQPKFTNKNEEALSRLEFYIETFKQDSKLSKKFESEIQNEIISSIASNFYRLDKERLKKLPLSILELIIFNENLAIDDEDSLLCFINELYTNDSSFSILFGAVYFFNVSKSAIEEFVDVFNIDDLDMNIWKSICYLLIHFDDDNNIVNDGRYHKR